MRADMAKVICERERSGGAWANATGNWSKGVRKELRYRNAEDAEEPLDSMPKRESMRNRRLRGDGYKMLNEHLAPLRRFLEKQVGRPWDKVHSEIVRTCGNTTTVQRHVMQHVRLFVNQRMVLIDGQVFERLLVRWSRHVGKDVLPLNESGVDLYVHPRTGLLCRNKHRPGNGKRASAARVAKRAAKIAETQRVINGVSYYKLSGLWFETWKERREERLGEGWGVVEHQRRRIVPTKQLRRLGLKNDEAA